MPVIELQTYRDGTEGASELVYASSSDVWLSGDSLGQLFTSKADAFLANEPLALSEQGITALAINSTNTECAVAFGNVVSVHRFPKVAEVVKSTICRFTLPVTHLAYDAENKHIFVSTREPDVSIYSSVLGMNEMTLRSFDTGVSTFALSQDSSLVALLDETGNIFIYRLLYTHDISGRHYTSNNLVHRLSGVLPRTVCRDNLSLHTGLSFSGDASTLAVPSTGSITVVDMTTFKETHFVSAEDTDISHYSNPVTRVAYSADSSHLLSCDSTGTIIIWNTSTALPLVSYTTNSPLIDVQWATDSSYFVAVSNTGYAVQHINLAEFQPKPKETANKLPTPTIPADATDTPSTPSKLKRPKSTVVDSDDDMEFDTSIDSIKRIMTSPSREIINDDDEPEPEPEMENMDYIVDDTPVAAVVTHPVLHPASTTADEKGRRILVWNRVGTITSKEDGMTNRIEIKFANADGRNKAESFPDRYGYTMAALSFEGAVFAAPKDEQTNESALSYHAFPNQPQLHGANEHFLYLNSNVVGVAVGCGYCACVTSDNEDYLRIISSTGTQRFISCLRGSFVSMVASGPWLAIVYQNQGILYVDLLQVTIECIRTITTTTLPQVILKWIGFAEDYFVFYTSTNMLIGLMGAAQYQCVPLLDCSSVVKTEDHAVWPIGISHDKFIYIMLNGISKPSVHPLPVPTAKPMRLPILETKNATENEFNRLYSYAAVMLQHQTQLNQCTEDQLLEYDKFLLRKFYEYCVANAVARATEIMLQLRCTQSLDAAILIANHNSKPAMAALLQSMKQERESAEAAAAAVVIQSQPEPYESQGYISDGYDDYTTTTPPTTNAHSPPSLPPPNPRASSPPPNMKRPPTNKFLATSPMSPSKRPRDVHAALRDMKGSPSPKKPALSRASSFSKEARSKKLFK